MQLCALQAQRADPQMLRDRLDLNPREAAGAGTSPDTVEYS